MISINTIMEQVVGKTIVHIEHLIEGDYSDILGRGIEEECEVIAVLLDDNSTLLMGYNSDTGEMMVQHNVAEE